jgi:protein SCO1/2
MNRRRLLALLTAALFVLWGCGDGPSFNSMDVTGADFGKDFRLTDSEGRTRTLADFRGKLVMVFFGFVQCPVVCPTALLSAVEVRKALGKDGEKIQVIFITLDPERDTPEVIQGYTAAFDPSFIGLYTDLAGTEKVAKDFRVFYQKVPAGNSYTIDHTAYTYVFDALGQLRLTVKHDQPSAKTAEDMRKLLDPLRPGSA